MYYNQKSDKHADNILFLDIETTGFECDKKTVSFAIKEYNGERRQYAVGNRHPEDDKIELEDLRERIEEYRMKDYNKMCTYNGENWSGGFDIPFLRTCFALNDVAWPFRRMRHLDLMPLIVKRFNMKEHEDYATILKKLPAKSIKQILEDYDIPAQSKATKDVNIALIKEHADAKKIKFEPYFEEANIRAISPGNKLDHVYEVFGGPALAGAEDMDGSKVPGMYARYVETQDDMWIKRIEEYNLTDVVQLDYVYRRTIPYLPEDEVWRAWTTL